MRVPLYLLGLAIGLGLMLALTNSGARSTAPLPATTTAAASATGAASADAAMGALVLQRCGTCHGLDTLSKNPQSAAGWAQTVDQMQQMGAQVAPDEKASLVAYLAQHFGK